MKIYACLIGNWVCLNDDDNCVMGDNFEDPITWYKNGGDIQRYKSKNIKEHTIAYTDKVKIHFKGKDYFINPIFLQFVVE